jgi:antitoxin (DNA-binding transcriptional repressor) of toxin-antitoxin stability system
MSTEGMEKEEIKIVRHASKAWRAAYLRAIKAGHSVLISDNGRLIRVMPNGKRLKVGIVPKRRKVKIPLKGVVSWKQVPRD